MKIKLKTNKINKLDKFYDLQIGSFFIKIFNDIIYDKIYELFNRDLTKAYNFIQGFYNYNYIISKSFGWKIHEIYEYKKILSFSQIINEQNKSILYYQPWTRKFLDAYECIFIYKLLNKKKSSVLELTSETPAFLEAINYYNNKYIKTNLDKDLLILNKYSYIKSKKIKNSKIIKKFNINKLLYDNFIDKEFILKKNKTYDIISSSISLSAVDYGDTYLEYANAQLFYLIFLFIINHLNIGGNVNFVIISIYTKPIADIILIAKKLFTNVNIYNSKINNKFKSSGVTLILKKFKGLDKDIFNKLLKIAETLLKLDPTSQNFNIIDKKLKEKYWLEKPITTKNIFYIEGFLNLPTSSSEYDFIREFNKEYYLEKVLYVKKLISYYHKYGDKVPNFIKEQQLVDSYLYAKEFELKTIPLDQGTFKSELGTFILNDMYCLHEPMKFEFTQRGNNNTNEVGIINLEKELEVLSREYSTITDAIDTRDIINWDRGKHISRYYKSGNKEIETLIQYIQKTFSIKVSQAWLKMYEICIEFPIINKNKKVFNSFHICELPGNFIRAINYYIITQTNIESYKWLAQSKKPDKHNKNIIGNDYGILEKFPEKWIFEKNGDITDVEVIKGYKKYFTNVDLLTSDCGLGWKDEEDISLIRVHFAQLVFMFYNLTKGGNFVCKFVLPLKENLHINMIYLMYKQFKKCYFYKPLQNMYSGEYYFIGIGYNPIDKIQLDKMFKLLKEFDKDSLSECICQTKYPKSFNHQIYNGIKKLTNNFMFNIERQFYYVDNAKYIPKAHVENLKKYIARKNEDWIERYKFKKLTDKDIYYKGYKSLL